MGFGKKLFFDFFKNKKWLSLSSRLM